MLDLPGIDSLLETVASEVKTFDECERKKAKEQAHRFEPFKYVQDNELGLCRIIADLLNPDGDHGQGALFLKRFLSLLSTPNECCDGARVATQEHTTQTDQNQRRIDIWIALNDGTVVAVEAKPFAVESEGQFKNMMCHAEKCARRKAYGLFLTSNGAKPKSIDDDRCVQLEKEGRLKLLCFDRNDGTVDSVREGLIAVYLQCQIAYLGFCASFQAT